MVGADGDGTDTLLGFELPAASRLGRVIAEGEPDVIDLRFDHGTPERIRALGLGPAMYLPLGFENPGQAAVLVVARAADGEHFECFDLNLVRVFAAAAAAMLHTDDIPRTAEMRRLIAEQQERIGNFLLNSTIKEAFQVSLILGAIRPMATPTIAPRIDDATERLDALIRNLRKAVFDSASG